MNLNTKFCHGISNEFYKANNFSGSEGIQIGGVTVNIESITSPSYFVGTQSDHITPGKHVSWGQVNYPKTASTPWVNPGTLQASLTLLNKINMVTGLVP
ncbi:hypothetical protein [Dryocola sp. LX212]